MKISEHMQKKRNAAKFRPTKPTMTDQSQANDTDINVIVKRYAVTGTAPGAKGQPIYEDWTHLPNDLRGLVEMARGLDAARDKLPPQLKNIPTEELLALTPDQIMERIKPAEEPASKPTNTEAKP